MSLMNAGAVNTVQLTVLGYQTTEEKCVDVVCIILTSHQEVSPCACLELFASGKAAFLTYFVTSLAHTPLRACTLTLTLSPPACSCLSGLCRVDHPQRKRKTIAAVVQRGRIISRDGASEH